MVYVHAIRLSGGATHRHIASVRWRNPDTGKNGSSTRAEMVAWLRKPASHAYVCGRSGHMAAVHVVEADPPYIRTYADDDWTDNLLALPRY